MTVIQPVIKQQVPAGVVALSLNNRQCQKNDKKRKRVQIHLIQLRQFSRCSRVKRLIQT